MPPETLAENGLGSPDSSPSELYERVRELRDGIAGEMGRRLRDWRAEGVLTAATGSWSSAENLAAYLALRAHDVRETQAALADLGLSSLGRCEAHVLPTLDAIIEMLGRALDMESVRRPSGERTTISGATAAARAALQRNSAALFGYPHAGLHPRIMVTLPAEAADDPDMVRALVAAGMDCARINCGHDTPATWVRMAANVRSAATRTGRSCSVLMDLSGPRLRTGAIGPGPAVVRVHPRRDANGHVVSPGTLVLDGTGAPGVPGVRRGPGRVAVDRDWLERIGVGDRITVTDLPGRRRTLQVVSSPSPGERTCEAQAGCFLGPGLELRHHPADGAPGSVSIIGPVDADPAEIRVAVGDELILSRDGDPGRPAISVDDGGPAPARIPIGAPEVIDHLRAGHRVFIDEGAIGAVVDRVDESGARLVIDSARPKGSPVKSGKGLNFPDTDLPLPSLTAEDLVALDTVVEIADAVGYSFVRRASDVHALVDALDQRRGQHLAILAKIETADGVANLPEIIVTGSQRHPFGVMIARGDLAIEIGYQRLADVQEEILWICEAAHVPAVWATQVLERLVQTGVPTRAEITDAVAAEGAECVMLNKGPYQLEGVEVLHDVLRRMAQRHDKKTDLLPALDLAK